jgi:thiol-disulfide isomerase/thioredoxin
MFRDDRRKWAAGLVICSIAALAIGQERQPSDVELPASPAQWVNSGPLSSEALQGKAAVLYFFEESCPRCRERWPELLATAKKFEGQPVAFIGVNSGNPRGTVESYARQVNCTWPIIVDPSREFEKSANVNEINLQNIYQVRLLTATGDLVPGDARDLANAAERALAGAKWNVDPANIPASLSSAWQAIEFGDFPAGAALVRKGLNSGKADVKEAATALNAYVQQELQKLLKEASQEKEAGNAWPTYKLYQRIGERFTGYEVPPEAAASKKSLAADPQVQKQLVAQKTLDAIRKAMASTSASAKRGAASRLKKLTEDAAGTDAAQEAQNLLSQLDK